MEIFPSVIVFIGKSSVNKRKCLGRIVPAHTPMVLPMDNILTTSIIGNSIGIYIPSAIRRRLPMENIPSPANFWICAIIGSVIGDWSYLACPKCNKKLEPVGLENICDSCYKTIKTGTYRYKLQLDVSDQTSNVSILLWDREAEKLIGRPCQELREEYVENVKTNKTELPYDLKKLIDQTVLFKVKIEKRNLHKENAVFPVTRMVTDPDIVAKYNQLTVEAESEADFMTLMLNEDINSGMNSDDEVSTPVKKILSTKSDVDRSCTNKSLNFDEECVGSSNAKIHSNPSMTKSQYMRKFVVEDDDDDEKQEFEEERGCENNDKSG
ncbi:hypothetical protein CASFOL_029031 [Castilleja foliolosa]|uniref:Replication factor A C-terminal domain-containing protein n=1 Tax=Castilleja foliolosa TaxID=1961234 RepID=A0ABD3CCV4_9LAMI